VPFGGGIRRKKGVECKYCVHMYVTGKMIPVHTVPGMGGSGNKEEWRSG
jgi:hypothetical protein